MKVEQLAPDIFSFRLLSDQQCKRMRQTARASEHWVQMQAYRTLGEGLPDHPLRRTLYPTKEPKAFEAFDEASHDCLRQLVKQHYGDETPFVNETHICDYVTGSLFATHPDAEPDTPLEHVRRYAIVCYLNDDFLGGHTLFPELNLAVEPKVGQAILFPTRLPHAGGKVVAGEKTILLAWMGYRRFEEWKHKVGENDGMHTVE